MIRVRLFASLKDAAGESCVELSLSDRSTVEEVYGRLLETFPQLGRFRAVTLTAVNDEYVDWEAPVEPGDSVAFFPPVSGGMHD